MHPTNENQSYLHYLAVLSSYYYLEFPGMMMSQMMNRMLLKRSRGRPRKEYDDMDPATIAQSGNHNMRGALGGPGGYGSGGPGRDLSGYDGIPSSSSTPLMSTDPSASAFEMNWMVNAGTSAVDGTRLTGTNNSFGRYSSTTTTRGGRFLGNSGLFGRIKQGEFKGVEVVQNSCRCCMISSVE